MDLALFVHILQIAQIKFNKKFNMKTLLIITSFFTLNTLLIDYRDSVCGSYLGQLSSFPLSKNQNTVNKTITTETVIVSKDNTDSLVIIITSKGVFKAKLYNGLVKSLSFPKLNGNFFSQDSLSFNLVFSGGPTKILFKGKK